MAQDRVAQELPHLVITTVNKEADAHSLTLALIEQRLAACVSRSSVSSTYRWQGAVENTQEIELTIKTSAARVGELIAFLQSHHPYSNPEILVIKVAGCAPSYAAWVQRETEVSESANLDKSDGT